MLVGDFSKEALENFRNLAVQYIKEGKIKHNKSNKKDQDNNYILVFYIQQTLYSWYNINGGSRYKLHYFFVHQKGLD